MILPETITMLIGAKLHIHTDYLNNTTDNTLPDLVIHWLNQIEHFTPYIHFILDWHLPCLDWQDKSIFFKGEKNYSH